jgi:hypothetical protein
MDNTDYDLDDATQVRLDVLQPLLNDGRPAVQEFADEARRRLNEMPGLVITHRGKVSETG